MALGVLNNLSAIYAENNLNNTNSSLQTVLQQLSSGSRINSGADDAAGLSLVNGLEANQTALTQSETNATEGVGLLQVADGALSQVTNLLDRAVTLATEASNGTLNSTQEAAANQEYQSIMAEITNIGSTTTYNQEQVFTGQDIAIYTGDSSTSGASIDDLNIHTLSTSNLGDSDGAMSYSDGASNVFIDLSDGGTNASASDSLNASGSTTITVNYLAKGSTGTVTPATANITVGTGSNFANTAQGMIDAINGSGLGLSASFGTAEQAGTVAESAAAAANAAGGGDTDTGIIVSGTGVGTGTNGAGEIGTLSAAASNDLLGGTLTIVGTDGKSHSIVLGTANSTDTLANLAATINAADYGVTASTNVGVVGGDAAGTVLTMMAASSAVTVSGVNLTDNGGSTALTGVATIATAYNSTVGTITETSAGASFTAGTLNIGSNAAITLGQAGTTDTLADLAATIDKGNYGVTATVNAANTAITFTSANSADTFSVTGATVGAGTVSSTTVVADQSQIGTLTLSAATNGATDVLTAGKTLVIGGNTFTVAVGGQTMAQFAASITSANDGITATVAANGATSEIMTFTSTSPATQGMAIGANTLADSTLGTATFATVTDTPSVANSAYYSVGITGAIADTSTNGGTLNAGMVTDTNGTGGIATISYSDGAGEDMSDSDLTDQVDAQSALNDLNLAVSDVAALDGYIGAQINTLNSISEVMSTQQENVVSAQNAIQATDYASATSNMSKYEILSQTGIAALAQANSVQQEVTKLLQ
ncbi:MAG: flagellin [Terracidiphilus sp.]